MKAGTRREPYVPKQERPDYVPPPEKLNEIKHKYNPEGGSVTGYRWGFWR